MRKMGFNIPADSKVSSGEATALNEIDNELPSTSDIDNANYIELQNITERFNKSIEDVINMVREIDESEFTLRRDI